MVSARNPSSSQTPWSCIYIFLLKGDHLLVVFVGNHSSSFVPSRCTYPLIHCTGSLYRVYTKEWCGSKLTKNIFLTLHVHNVHRQQRQLSKFHMHYQKFASHAYCRAVWPVSKMALQQEKAFCVLRLEVSRFVITVQREFHARFRKEVPHRNNINRWYRQFVETGCLCKDKSPGRPHMSDDNIERVR